MPVCRLFAWRVIRGVGLFQRPAWQLITTYARFVSSSLSSSPRTPTQSDADAEAGVGNVGTWGIARLQPWAREQRGGTEGMERGQGNNKAQGKRQARDRCGCCQATSCPRVGKVITTEAGNKGQRHSEECSKLTFQSMRAHGPSHSRSATS